MSDRTDAGNAPRSRTPSAVAEVLDTFFAPPERHRKLRAYRLWQFWHDVVGDQIAAHARPLRLRDSTLEVRVDQPVWMQQLQLLKPQLLERLNRRLGEELISDLYFRRGRLEPDHAPAVDNRKTPLPPLTTDDRKKIAATVAVVADAELRSDLERLLQYQLRLDKARETSD